MQNFLFLAQEAAGVNTGAGTIMLFVMLACVAVIVGAAIEFMMHRSFWILGVGLIAVILCASSPNIVNTLFHGIGGSTNTITPTAAD